MTEKIERQYVVPLRRACVKTCRYLRAKKAMRIIREFMKRHMKSDDIKLGMELNELVWSRGGQTIPSKVTLTALKEDEKVYVNLVGKPLKKEKKEEKTEKEEEVKKETKKEEKTEEVKLEVKEPEKKEEENETKSVKKRVTKKSKEEKINKEVETNE